MDELFMSYATIFYSFPSFALEVKYNNKHVLSAQFSCLDDKHEMASRVDLPLTHEIIAQLDSYYKNPLFKFTLPLSFTGSIHQLKLWQLMRQIKCGQVLSYGAAGALLQSAPRAIGNACGKNPLPVFIPCHRIIAANDKLGGFNAGHTSLGVDIKKWLLVHEKVFLS